MENLTTLDKLIYKYIRWADTQPLNVWLVLNKTRHICVRLISKKARKDQFFVDWVKTFGQL